MSAGRDAAEEVVIELLAGVKVSDVYTLKQSANQTFKVNRNVEKLGVQLPQRCNVSVGISHF